MKQKKFKFKLFGWYIYFSRKRLKNRCPQLKVVNHNVLAERMKQVKNVRYKSNGGCCEVCGKHMEMKQMQMHHVLPHNEFPMYVRKEWNLMMVCRRCHYMIHHNPFWAIDLMQNVANRHGINLQMELRMATAQRWQEKEERLLLENKRC